MIRNRFVILCLVLACGTTRADDPEEKGAKPHDIKIFVPTPEPAMLPEDLRKPGIFDDEYPIPQDKSKAEKNRAEWLAWWKKQSIQAWDENGKKDSPTAVKAKAALEAVAKMKAAVNLKDAIAIDDAVEALRQALLAECDDPLVRYYAFPHHGVNGEPGRGTYTEIMAFTEPLLQGKYPLALKSRIAWDVAVRLENNNNRSNDPNAKTAAKFYDEFWKHYVELAKSKDRFDQDLVVELAREVEAQYVRLGQKRQDGHAAVMQAFEMANVEPWVKLTTEGNYKFFSALDAKQLTTSESAKLVKERIASARKAYTAAWEANKEMPEAASMMIRVCQEESVLREEMETWFVKAMTADPDSYVSCQSKLSFLKSSQSNNQKVLIAFGRQCLRTMNQHAALGYILDEAHRMAGAGKGRQYNAEANTWADLREVYETRLKQFPTDRYARTRFGAICLAAGEGPGAFQHLSSVKKQPWPGLLSSFASSLKEAEELSREQTGKP